MDIFARLAAREKGQLEAPGAAVPELSKGQKKRLKEKEWKQQGSKKRPYEGSQQQQQQQGGFKTLKQKLQQQAQAGEERQHAPPQRSPHGEAFKVKGEDKDVRPKKAFAGVCNLCGGVGHKSKHCPGVAAANGAPSAPTAASAAVVPAASKRPAGDGGEGTFEGTCNACGRAGHKSKHCPLAEGGGQPAKKQKKAVSASEASASKPLFSSMNSMEKKIAKQQAKMAITQAQPQPKTTNQQKAAAAHGAKDKAASAQGGAKGEEEAELGQGGATSLTMKGRSKSYGGQTVATATWCAPALAGAAPHSQASSSASSSSSSSAAAASSSSSSSSCLTVKGATKLTALQEAMRKKLEGAKFRLINEQLYTTSGADAFKAYTADPSLFEVYHSGYREQVAKWPENPLTAIQAWLKAVVLHKTPTGAVVADFGCGEAMLSLHAPKGMRVHSFDLVAANERVTACDMAHVPLADETVDAAVFCLSLMGTNLADYLREAKRVLRRPHGLLKVAEVRSRVDGMEGGLPAFVGQLCSLGFKCLNKDLKNPMFVLLEFGLLPPTEGPKNPRHVLTATERDAVIIAPKPCIYKRR